MQEVTSDEIQSAYKKRKKKLREKGREENSRDRNLLLIFIVAFIVTMN